MSGPASSEKAQKQMRLRAENEARTQESDVRAVMSTPAGRRFVWRVLYDLSGLDTVCLQNNNHTFFNEGRRSVAGAVLREIRLRAPADYVHMLKEHLQKQLEDELHKRSAESATEDE